MADTIGVSANRGNTLAENNVGINLHWKENTIRKL